ncbi:hypothetical protein MCHI_002331, partial [Candidatus Magnetoovum chiemensis]
LRYRIDGVLRALENKALSEEAVNYALFLVSILDASLISLETDL